MDENNFISFDDLKNKILSDPEAKKSYDELEERFEIIYAFIEIKNKLIKPLGYKTKGSFEKI